MPIIVNITILNGMDVVGEVVGEVLSFFEMIRHDFLFLC
jgi:hypothetical protein